LEPPTREILVPTGLVGMAGALTLPGMVSAMRKPAASLRGQIVILVCFVAVTTSLVGGSLSYKRISDTLTEHEFAKIRNETRLIAPRFLQELDQLRVDALTIRDMPPFAGMVRSRINGGKDPIDGSTFAQWRQRLATIFTAIIRERPHYVQMRYISIADGGQEIVRVDRQ
jgi:hypothetical protein